MVEKHVFIFHLVVVVVVVVVVVISPDGHNYNNTLSN